MLDQDAIAGRIKLLRGSKSQQKFSEALGYKQAYISEIETGRAKPSVEFLYALSVRYNVTVDWILKGDNPEPQENIIPMVPIDIIRDALKTAEESLARGRNEVVNFTATV